MTEPKWIDFHTHRSKDEPPPEHGVASFSLPQLEYIVPQERYTLGLHPWDTDRLDAYRLVDNILPEELAKRNCLALGEVGLDRLRGAALEVQQELLSIQLKLAQKLRLPVVVHCVRAWSELISCIRKVQFSGNKAVHGFRASVSVLPLLLEDDWYISVGPEKNGMLSPLVAEIPRTRLLLETDDSSIPILEVYRQAAELRKTTVVALQQQVNRNIRNFFKQRTKSPHHI